MPSDLKGLWAYLVTLERHRAAKGHVPDILMLHCSSGKSSGTDYRFTGGNIFLCRSIELSASSKYRT